MTNRRTFLKLIAGSPIAGLLGRLGLPVDTHDFDPVGSWQLGETGACSICGEYHGKPLSAEDFDWLKTPPIYQTPVYVFAPEVVDNINEMLDNSETVLGGKLYPDTEIAETTLLGVTDD